MEVSSGFHVRDVEEDARVSSGHAYDLLKYARERCSESEAWCAFLSLQLSGLGKVERSCIWLALLLWYVCSSVLRL